MLRNTNVELWSKVWMMSASQLWLECIFQSNVSNYALLLLISSVWSKNFLKYEETTASLWLSDNRVSMKRSTYFRWTHIAHKDEMRGDFQEMDQRLTDAVVWFKTWNINLNYKGKQTLSLSVVYLNWFYTVATKKTKPMHLPAQPY